MNNYEEVSPKAVAFTGHRPNALGGYNENNPTAVFVKEGLKRIIDQLIAKGYHTFITGMALGVDMWAAEIVLERKKIVPELQLLAAVPFEGQEKKWPKSSQERFHSILRQANRVEIVCEGGYAGWKMQKRNEWMVDHAEVLVCVWNGLKSGTGNCVAYAKQSPHQPTIFQINPTEMI